MPNRSTMPLVAAAALDRPAIKEGQADWTWRQIHAASIELATRLHGTETLINLCHSRVGFLVTWLAALRWGCLQILPPSNGQIELVAILRSSSSPTIVVDDARLVRTEWDAHARCIVHVPRRHDEGRIDADLSWAPDWHAPLLRLYTSGSTGEPVPQVKTLAQMIRGAEVLAARIEKYVEGGLSVLRPIVCSVPPQHMYGLEASVMLPLVYGMPVLDKRPLLAADVLAAFQECGADKAVWIAAPLHLRALVCAGQAVSNCGLVIASTMAMTPTLAAEAEALIGASVLEIYGSTETGALATRRTACEVDWLVLDGVSIEAVGEVATAWGTHFPSPQQMADRIDIETSRRFRLLGRQSELIKIGGRRASLAGLNLHLQELPGLDDGVFYLPDGHAATERLVVIQAGVPLRRVDVNAWLRERIDPMFLPRALIHVDRLPRNEHGKLSRAALDEIYHAWLAGRRPR